MAENTVLDEAAIFNGGEFLITPAKDEIDMGMVIAGHRFVVFCDDVFISEATVSLEGGEKLEWTSGKYRISDLFNRYAFLGVEEIFPTLTAESQENYKVLAGKKTSPDTRVSVSALECKELFSKNGFEEDDALLVRIVDFSKGIFVCRTVSASERKASAQKEWCAGFTAALKKVIEEHGDSLTIPQQLRRVFAINRELLNSPGASLDEFYMQDNDFTIAMEQGQSFLALRPDLPDEITGTDDPAHLHHHDGGCDCGGDDEEDNGAVHIPPGFGISRGETASLGAILKDLKLPVTIPVIDGFMLDQLFGREYDFESFYSRAFPETPDFADEAQEVVFLNELEERFEHFVNRYDHAGDEIRGQLRNRVMMLVETRLETFNSFISNGGDPEKLPEKTKALLADSEACFDRILDMLNSPGYTPDPSEAEAMAESIENAAELEAAALEEL